ncbi:hypothetical protein ACFFRR_006566 [Megaselia abdita]
MIVQILIALYTLLGVGYIYWKIRPFLKLSNSIPAVGRLPFTGQFTSTKKLSILLPSIGEFLGRVSTTYFTWLGSVPTVVLSNPEYAKQVLAKTYVKVDNIRDINGSFVVWMELLQTQVPTFIETIKKTKSSDFMNTVDIISRDVLKNLDNLVGQPESNLLLLFEIEEIAYRTGMPFLYEKFAQIKREVSSLCFFLGHNYEIS